MASGAPDLAHILKILMKKKKTQLLFLRRLQVSRGRVRQRHRKDIGVHATMFLTREEQVILVRFTNVKSATLQVQ